MISENLLELSGILALLGFGAFYIGVYNNAQRILNLIPEVASNIQVLTRKRTDLISKLIAIVDSYGLHERGVDTTVAREFGGSTNPGSLGGVVQRLASLRMSFQELRADGLYASLMQELALVESDIAKKRERYNATVRSFNTLISQFPINLLLLPFGYQPKPFLSEQDFSAP